MMREKIERLPNFLKRYGPIDGLRLGLGVSGRGSDPAVPATSLKVPDFHSPIWLRPTRSDYSIFWQCVVRRQYDLSRFPQMQEILRRSQAMIAAGQRPLVIDGGANIGMSLRGFARDFPQAHVIAVEPDTDNFRVLTANAGELVAKHTLVQGAIASQSGHSRIIARERGSAGFMTEYCDASHPEAIRAYSVPDLVAMVPNGQPWIVKLDIEGGQDELFSRDTGWVEDADLIMLEPDDWAFPWQGTTINFLRALAPYPFDYVLDGEMLLCFRHR
jgi:FkbM family methyltransferase